MGVFDIFSKKYIKQGDKSSPKSEIAINMHDFVKEIHAAFENELSNILTAANIKEELEELNDSLLKKSEQLRSLGFINTPEVLEINKLIAINAVTIKENKERDCIIEAINYFRQKYPLYKIITLESLDEICEKYQLGYAAIRAYSGTVPQKNLDRILEANIENHDKAILRDYVYSDAPLSDRVRENAEIRLEFYTNSNSYLKSINGSGGNRVYSPLIIAAPPSDFISIVQKSEKFGKLNPIKNLEDPIVMQPVEYKNKIFLLIITAWGPEASDPNITNELFN